MKQLFFRYKYTLVFIFSVLAAILIGFLIYFIYGYLKKPSIKPMQAIPENAVVILKVKSATSTWNELASKTDMWADIAKFEDFQKVNTTMHWLDSLVNTDALVSKIVKEQTLYISAHPNSNKQFSWLFAIEVPKDFEKGISRFLDNISKANHLQSVENNGVTIYKNAAESGFSYFLYKGVFVGSYDFKILEQSIAQIHINKSLEEDGLFQQIVLSEGKKTPVSLYINHQQIYTTIAEQLNPSAKKTISSLNLVNGWSNSDVVFRKDLLLMSGFLAFNANSYLSCLEGSKPQNVDFAKELDENTFYFHAVSFGNADNYRKKYNEYLQLNKISPNTTEYYHNDSLGTLASVTNLWMQINPTQLVISATTIGDSTAWILTAKPQNIIDAEKVLTNEVVSSTAPKSKADTSSYKGYKIGRLSLQKSARIFGDELFSGVSIEYYAIGKNFILFSSSKENLKYTIDQTRSEKSLENSYIFKSYTHDLNSDALVLIYASPIQGLDFLDNYLESKFQSNRLLKLLAKSTPYVGVQVGKFDGKLLSTSFCWKYLANSSNYTELEDTSNVIAPIKAKSKDSKSSKTSKKKSSKKSSGKKSANSKGKSGKTKKTKAKN